MRIACVGKGGSGKTTLSSLLVKKLMATQTPLLAIDADINQHLGAAIGLPEDVVDQLPEVGNQLTQLKEILRGKNTLIPSTSAMIKTTLPGPGSHLINLRDDDAVLTKFALRDNQNNYFLRVGGFTQDDLGARCFHAKTGGAELILNHLMDTPDDVVVVDMTAGADAFASGLFTRFDLTVLVVEPTLKSLSVYEQYKAYAADYGVALAVVGNKVEDEEDLAFLEQKCQGDLIGALTKSKWVKRTERGENPSVDELETENMQVLEKVLTTLESQKRCWETYWKWGWHFHEKNALSWANDDVGMDVRQFTNKEFLKSFAPDMPNNRQSA